MLKRSLTLAAATLLPATAGAAAGTLHCRGKSREETKVSDGLGGFMVYECLATAGLSLSGR